ncbi:MAG: hypothetical protein IH585_20270 [Anaerolineaceae bacterium]|nr:hypothetical protein [Anaerolineaceae bacterium]
MPPEIQPFLSWSSNLGFLTEGHYPVVTSCFQNGQLQILVGNKNLYAFNLLGKPLWTFETKGLLKKIVPLSIEQNSNKFIIYSESTSDVLVSSANLLTYTYSQGNIYFFEEEQNPKIKLTFHQQKLSSLEICSSLLNDSLWICMGITKLGHRSNGLLQILDINGNTIWERAFSSPVTSLKCCMNSDKEFCLLAGTELGELIALDCLGNIKWERKALNEKVTILCIANSSKDSFQLVVGGKLGNFSVCSLSGDLLWSDQGKSVLLGISCMDVDEDGEDEILTFFADRLSCYRLSGDILWTVRFENEVLSFNPPIALDKEIMICSGEDALILDAGNGSLLWKINLQGQGVACCKWESDDQSGWVVCIEKKPKRKMIGIPKYNQLFLGLITHKSVS